MNYPGATAVDALPNSNHQQMRNDTNTKDKLNKLWIGDYGEFFITDPQ